jgi:hypothetical protein
MFLSYYKKVEQNAFKNIREFIIVIMSTKKVRGQGQEEQKKGLNCQFFVKKHESEIKEGGIPMLKYRKGAFQQALSRKVAQEYGDLTKLIDLGKYHVPVLEVPNYNTHEFIALILSNNEKAAMQLEALRDHARQIERMKADRP